MANMDQTILIAIISASSALIGALTPNIINLFTEKGKRKFEIKKELLNKQQEIYQESMFALQSFMNNQSPENIENLQKAIIKVSIFGDDKTSKNINDYFLAIVNSNLDESMLLSLVQHEKFHLDIMNSIRNKMGFNKFDNFKLIRYNPEGVS
ncbi:hypothetical protein [Elizabethkingia meningoseptica]|uniref:hypothetical protein n=1 Tax=Elizabethkingia meningoseptica TaxID=238 RepID=UPI000937AA8C|nr:hypothetical protein [Elizabethkingia meningoseptica]